MIEPRIEIRDEQVMAAFGRLQQFARDPREGLEAIGRVIKSKVQLGFHTGTDPYGRPWAPLKSRAGQPLRDKGHLMSSYDYNVSGNSVDIGTNNPHAPVHHHGAVIRPKSSDPDARLRFMVNGVPVFAREVTIPARQQLPLDGLPQDWSDDVSEAISRVITDQWNR